MIIPREVLVRPGIIDSERVCALPIACQLFFRNLLHACDGRGRFPADAAELRSAFYRRCPGVSTAHVEAWLVKCHQARLVMLYTSGGRAYGEVVNYGQRDTKRRELYPSPDDGELNFAGPPADPPDPPDRPSIQKNRMEGKGKERAGRATPAPDSQELWLSRLREQFPGVDVDAELRAAARNRALQNKKLERQWFERHWLANLSTVVEFTTAAGTTQTVQLAEPEGWRVYLKDRYYEEEWAQTAQVMPWASLPKNWQEKILREVRRTG